MRVYTKLREMMLTQKDILIKLEQLEMEILKQSDRTKKQETDIQIIFDALKQLLTPPSKPKVPVGFKIKQ